MSVSTYVVTLARKASAFLLLGLMAGTGFAQNAAPSQASSLTEPVLTPMPQAPAPQNNAHPYSDQDYSKGKKSFPNIIAPYTVRNIPAPNLTNTARVDQILHDGNLYLSINDAVALALENNLDIVVQRYNLSIADTDLLRTDSGNFARGVNTGLVQGTPGGNTGSVAAGGTGTSSTGSTGGGAGGTTVGVGGAGSGAAGIVTSTLGFGPTIDSFDPIVAGTVSSEHATTPQSTVVFTGTPSLIQNTQLANFTYTQGFATGTLMSVGYNNSRVTTNDIYNFISPNLTPSFRFEMRQHLLQGFGFNPNLRWIRIARNNREIEDVTFRNQIITTVSQVENIYWDLVNAYENVKVQQRALELAQKTLSDNEEQVRIGTLAPITVVQAQSGVASAKQNLITSQTNLQLQQLLMKNAITKNMTDPILAVAPVIPTDTLQLNEQYEVRPVQDLIQEALQARPEIAVSRISLTNSDITRKSIRNLLRPTVDLFAFYGGSALAGDQNPAVPDCGTPNVLVCLPPNTIPSTGYGHAFTNLFNSTAPDKGVGVNVNIPLRNRSNQADQVRSELEYRQAVVLAQQQENSITLQVRQAQFAVQQNYAALQAAIAAQDFADQSLLAEQKKFQYGASTPTLVLQASSNLTQAQSNVLASATNYEKSKVQLDLVTAETLKKLGIDIADAEAGQVKTVPKVPGVVPVKTQETVPQQLQEQQQKQQREGTQPQPQPQPQQQQQPPTQPH
jgi:outer membrane protein TolC